MAALRDVSVILLVIESLILLLIPAAILAACVYGLHTLRRKLPPVFAQVHKYLALFHHYVNRASAAAAAPVIKTHAAAAQWGAWWDRLAGFVKEKN